MHPWFSWIRWLNPFYYGFEGEQNERRCQGVAHTKH